MKWLNRFLLLLCFLVLSGYGYKQGIVSRSGLSYAVRVSQNNTANSEKLKATEVDDDDDDQFTSSKKGLNISNYFIPSFFNVQLSGYFNCFSANSGTGAYSSLDKYIINRVIRT